MHAYYLLYCAIGMLAGLSSGLFGIGGGIIVVPGLALVLPYTGMPEAYIMHIAIGTSLAIMVVTASASVRSHYRRNHIVWSSIRHLLPGIIIGLMIGAYSVHHIPSVILSKLFGIFLFVATYYMLFGKPRYQTHTCPPLSITILVSLAIGLKSGLLGIGGGMIIIPFLTYCGMSMRNAAGTSSFCTLSVAVVGTLCFMLTGQHTHLWPYSTGYIYWPAFAGVATTSFIFAPLGAALSAYIPGTLARRLFAIILCVTALKMVF